MFVVPLTRQKETLDAIWVSQTNLDVVFLVYSSTRINLLPLNENTPDTVEPAGIIVAPVEMVNGLDYGSI